MVSLAIDPTTGAPNGVHSVPFHLEDYPIDDKHRRLKIAMSALPSIDAHLRSRPSNALLPAVGAGFSGIIAGVRIPQRLTNVDLSIFEKNHSVGGTWCARI